MFGRKKSLDDRFSELLAALTGRSILSREQMYRNELDVPNTSPFSKGVIIQHENTLLFTLLSLTTAVLVLKEGGTEEQAEQAYYEAMITHMEKQWDDFAKGKGYLRIPLPSDFLDMSP